MRQYKIVVTPGQRAGEPYSVLRVGDQLDPLDQKSARTAFGPAPNRNPSQYEEDFVTLWDYWYKDGDDICNAILIEQVIVDGPHKHPEMPDIPFIVVEHEHEPGNPDGISAVEPLLDIQIELNRLLSHALQHVADNVDPAFQAYGNDVSAIEPGTVPKSNEILVVGDGKIDPISTGVNVMPFDVLIKEMWNSAHRISGEPEILFGQAASDISGRATAIQIQSAVNRIDAPRSLLYQALGSLLNFWFHMAVRRNPIMSLGMDEDGNERKGSLRELIEGMTRWRFIAPELTPRDSQELVATEGQKVTLGLSSKRDSMDAIGVESPEAMQDRIREERNDLVLSPAEVQQKISAFLMMLQYQQQLQAMQMQEADLQAQSAAVGQQQGGMSATAQAQKATNTAQQGQAAQQAAAGPVAEDQNQPLPGATQQTLIRAGGAPGGQALNQVSFSGPV